MVCCRILQHGSSRRLSAVFLVAVRGLLLFFCPKPDRYTKNLSGSQKEIINLSSRMAAEREGFMAFFTSAITILQTLVVALGAGLAVWGVINLLEGYGNDNPGAKSQGIKQLMAGGGVALIGTQLVPLLANLFG